jgi:hypothetical protein
VRDAAAHAGERARQAGAQVADRARQQATETGEQAKAGAADEMERTAHALEAAADELEGAPMQRELFREAAQGLMDVSSAVRGRSIGEIVEELSAFGRRNPYGFLGGAALAGFAVARFARASAGPRSGDAGGTRYAGGGETRYAGGETRYAGGGSSMPTPEIRRPTDE